MASVFNPVFLTYNQAVTDHDRLLQVTEYIHNADSTQVLTQEQYDEIPGDDKEYDYSSRTTGPAIDAARGKNEHINAIKDQTASVAPTQRGSLNLASISQDDRYRLEGIARERSRTNSKGNPEMTHTMGDYLLPAFKEFENLQIKNANFWEWVEEEIGKDATGAAKRWNPHLYGATEQKYHQHLIRWFEAGVKYINETQTRERYKVTFDGGRLMRRLCSSDNDPRPLDREEVVDQFTKKGNPPGALIWVLGSACFYSHMAKTGRFHHSSFFRGGALTAAGEWEVEKGKLLWISGQSGHYRPGFDFLVDAVNALPGLTLTTGGTKVRVFQQKTPVDLSPKKFLEEAAKGTLGSQGLTAFPA